MTSLMSRVSREAGPRFSIGTLRAKVGSGRFVVEETFVNADVSISYDVFVAFVAFDISVS
jgi:hypothetical protein